jgi:hypothetical protein
VSLDVREEADIIAQDPYFYIPKSAFIAGVLEKADPSTKKSYWVGRLRAGGKSTSRVLGFDPSGALENLIRIEVSALGMSISSQTLTSLIAQVLMMITDAWFVEDEKLLGPHPKDPYKRIETIPSSREIRIEVEGKEVARSSQNVFLFETMLRPRFYLSAVDVKWEFLSESETTTFCPYKGMAKYV